jgi:hypothetical protein
MIAGRRIVFVRRRSRLGLSAAVDGALAAAAVLGPPSACSHAAERLRLALFCFADILADGADEEEAAEELVVAVGAAQLGDPAASASAALALAAAINEPSA